MKPTIKVVNAVEFKTAMEHLQDAARGEAVKRAALAGGHVIEAYAKINVEQTFSSKSTGGAGLGGSIQTVVDKATNTEAQVSVGPSVVYGRIQELGGWIEAVHAKALSWINEQGERVFAKKVYIPPRPYLRPAVDEHMDEIEQAVKAEIRASIIRAAGEGSVK